MAKYSSRVRKVGRFDSRLELQWDRYFRGLSWTSYVEYIGDRVDWADFLVDGVYIEIKPEDEKHSFVQKALDRCAGHVRAMLIIEGRPGWATYWMVYGNTAKSHHPGYAPLQELVKRCEAMNYA